MFGQVKGLETNCKEVEGGSYEKLCFSEERGKVWMDYIERIMNEENDRDHNADGDAVEGPREFAYLGDRMRAGRGCVAAVTAKT